MATIVGFPDHHAAETGPFIAYAKAALFDRDYSGTPVRWRATRGSYNSVRIRHRRAGYVWLRMGAPYREVEVWRKGSHRTARDLVTTLTTPQAVYDYVMDA